MMTRSSTWSAKGLGNAKTSTIALVTSLVFAAEAALTGSGSSSSSAPPPLLSQELVCVLITATVCAVLAALSLGLWCCYCRRTAGQSEPDRRPAQPLQQLPSEVAQAAAAQAQQDGKRRQQTTVAATAASAAATLSAATAGGRRIGGQKVYDASSADPSSAATAFSFPFGPSTIAHKEVIMATSPNNQREGDLVVQSPSLPRERPQQQQQQQYWHSPTPRDGKSQLRNFDGGGDDDFDEIHTTAHSREPGVSSATVVKQRPATAAGGVPVLPPAITDEKKETISEMLGSSRDTLQRNDSKANVLHRDDSDAEVDLNPGLTSAAMNFERVDASTRL